MNVPGQNLSSTHRKACMAAVTHGSVVKTHKIDVLKTHVKPAKRI